VGVAVGVGERGEGGAGERNADERTAIGTCAGFGACFSLGFVWIRWFPFFLFRSLILMAVSGACGCRWGRRRTARGDRRERGEWRRRCVARICGRSSQFGGGQGGPR
jgi:hypothetical protein